MLISPEIRLLEVELGELNTKQKELVNIISEIDFDFDNFEPIFVQFPGSDKHYIYQAKRDALVYLDDIVLVPVNSGDTFKTATVSMTFDLLGEYLIEDIDLNQVDYVIQNFKNIRYIVANLGKLDGAFFDDYFYEIDRKKKRKELIELIEKRAKIAKQAEYFKGIAKTDSVLQGLLGELDELGGF